MQINQKTSMRTVTISVENKSSEVQEVNLFDNGYSNPQVSIVCEELKYEDLLEIISKRDHILFGLNISNTNRSQLDEFITVGRAKKDKHKRIVSADLKYIKPSELDLNLGIEPNDKPVGISISDFVLKLNKRTVFSFVLNPSEKIIFTFDDIKLYLEYRRGGFMLNQPYSKLDLPIFEKDLKTGVQREIHVKPLSEYDRNMYKALMDNDFYGKRFEKAYCVYLEANGCDYIGSCGVSAPIAIVFDQKSAIAIQSRLIPSDLIHLAKDNFFSRLPTQEIVIKADADMAELPVEAFINNSNFKE